MTDFSSRKEMVEAEQIQCLKEMEKQLATDPTNFPLREEYACLLNDNGFVKEAIEQYKCLITYIPDEPGFYYNLGVSYEKINDLEKALDVYKKCVQLDPEFVDARYNLAYTFDRLGQYVPAIQEYEKTIKLDPKDSNAHFNLGCVLSKCGDSDGAIRHLACSIKLNPRDEYAYFYLAYEMQKLGRLDEALKGYANVLKINPDYSWAHYNMGFIFLHRGQKQKAYEEFKITYKLNPHDFSALEKLLEVGIECGYQDEMLDILEELIIKDPKDSFAHFNIAEIYFEQKEYEDALHHYKQALNSPKVTECDIDQNKLKTRIKMIQSKLSKRI